MKKESTKGGKYQEKAERREIGVKERGIVD